MGTGLLAGVCLAVVPAVSKRCANTELPCRARALSCHERRDEGKGREAPELRPLPWAVVCFHRYHADFTKLLFKVL